MNRIVLVGRLTADPELRYTTNGKAVCSFTLAVDRRFKRDEADFIPVIVWDKQGEAVSQYLVKGSQCGVDGSLQIRSYEGKNGKVKVAEVIAETVEFLSKVEKHNPQPEHEEVFNNDDMVGDDELPFN